MFSASIDSKTNQVGRSASRELGSTTKRSRAGPREESEGLGESGAAFGESRHGEFDRSLAFPTAKEYDEVVPLSKMGKRD